MKIRKLLIDASMQKRAKLLLTMDNLVPYSGCDGMAVTGIVGRVMLQLEMGISLASNGRD